VSKSRQTWATSVPILVSLGLSVLKLGPMYAKDVRQTDVRCRTDVSQKHRLMPPPYVGGGIIRLQLNKANFCATVVDCGSIGPFYNGFKEEHSTIYGAVIRFWSVSVLVMHILNVSWMSCWTQRFLQSARCIIVYKVKLFLDSFLNCICRNCSVYSPVRLFMSPPRGALSDDDVWRLSRTSGRRAAYAAGRLDGAYWLIGPGSAGPA